MPDVPRSTPRTVQCYLCGCSELRPRPGAVRDNPALQILECRDCALVMLSSAEHVAGSHYADSGMHGDAVLSIEEWLRVTEQDDRRRFEMLEAALVNRRVLDFGCGAGGFLIKARSVAAAVAGVEPERRVREYWGDRLALCDRLEDAGTHHDFITAFHVLEHLPDPRASLQELARHLAKGGRLVVEVPSSDDALLTVFESDAFRHFNYWSQHLFLFNAETLRRLAVQAGLRVVAVQQFQRYPLSNHLHWLSRKRPGGHQHWSFLDTPALNAAYAASLASIGKCDTVIAHLEPTS